LYINRLQGFFVARSPVVRRFFPLYAACFGEQMANRNEYETGKKMSQISVTTKPSRCGQKDMALS